MKILIKLIKGLLVSSVIIVIVGFSLLYAKQEQFIFHPEPLANDYQFSFKKPYSEKIFTTDDGQQLHGVLFKAAMTKGLIFFLHGNTGNVAYYQSVGEYFVDCGYDIFMLDYRGYGKSTGELTNESEMFKDVQLAFDKVTSGYEKTVVVGYSIGTGPATWIAANNKVDGLILQAPYYSLIDMKDQMFSFVPDAFLKYKFETNKHLQKVKAPVLICHGTDDKVINYSASERLSKHLKEGDVFVKMDGKGHGNITGQPEFKEAFNEFVMITELQ